MSELINELMNFASKHSSKQSSKQTCNLSSKQARKQYNTMNEMESHKVKTIRQQQSCKQSTKHQRVIVIPT